MFTELLKTIVASVEGAIVCGVIGFDGITVESESGSNAQLQEDLGQAWIEFANAIHQAMPSVAKLKTGAMTECTLGTQNTCSVIRLLNQDYFLALGLVAGGNFGKGRYLLRLAAPVIAREL